MIWNSITKKNKNYVAANSLKGEIKKFASKRTIHPSKDKGGSGIRTYDLWHPYHIPNPLSHESN